MKLNYQQASGRTHLEQILELQRNNLPENLSPEEKKSEGFLTVRHSLSLLEQMNRVCRHIIALDGEILAGYALSMHPAFADDIPVLQPMFAELKPVLAPDARFMVMGQVCVAKPYRGRGVFRGLYNSMRTYLQKEYDWIITEVDATNTRSLDAHSAIGFTGLAAYHSGGQNWEIIGMRTAPAGSDA